jgi:fructose-bisphosphate aldolase class I
MNLDELNSIARKMVAPGKGLLAADESTSTIGKRFDAINTANTEENRRDYREFMFRTTEAMKGHISGVILYDETIRQKAKDGSTLVSIIEAAGAIPGIKVDAGTSKMPAFPGELVTLGLDGLRERFAEYHKLGRHRADHRAGSADGRRPHRRPLRGSHHPGA